VSVALAWLEDAWFLFVLLRAQLDEALREPSESPSALDLMDVESAVIDTARALDGEAEGVLRRWSEQALAGDDAARLLNEATVRALGRLGELETTLASMKADERSGRYAGA